MVVDGLHTYSLCKLSSAVHHQALSKFVTEMLLATGNLLYDLKRVARLSVPIVMAVCFLSLKIIIQHSFIQHNFYV